MSTSFTVKPIAGSALPTGTATTQTIPAGLLLATDLRILLYSTNGVALGWARVARVWGDGVGGGITVEAEPGSGPPPP